MESSIESGQSQGQTWRIVGNKRRSRSSNHPSSSRQTQNDFEGVLEGTSGGEPEHIPPSSQSEAPPVVASGGGGLPATKADGFGVISRMAPSPSPQLSPKQKEISPSPLLVNAGHSINSSGLLEAQDLARMSGSVSDTADAAQKVVDSIVAPPLLCLAGNGRPHSFLSSNFQSLLSGRSPAESLNLITSKLAAKVKFIDGSINRAPLLSDRTTFPDLSSNTKRVSAPIGLNAGPQEGAR